MDPRTQKAQVTPLGVNHNVNYIPVGQYNKDIIIISMSTNQLMVVPLSFLE